MQKFSTLVFSAIKLSKNSYQKLNDSDSLSSISYYLKKPKIVNH